MLFHKSMVYSHPSHSVPYPNSSTVQTPYSSPASSPPSPATNTSGRERSRQPQGTGDSDLDQIIENAGYAYDPVQDMFYSTVNPWQRRVGYSRLYDEASASMGMIIDSESIFFDYNDQKWMIGFWKGQYDLVTGGEIGLYKGAFHLTLPGIFSGMFYKSVSDTEMIPMSFVLKKNDRVLLSRDDTHWWLTGFKLGEFSQPSELSMEISLTFPEQAMLNAFLSGLEQAGYSAQEYSISGNSIQINFFSPHTIQPKTRSTTTDSLIQMKNKLLCDKYLQLTAPYDNIRDKMKAIESQAPDLYKTVLRIGKSKEFYELWIMILMFGLISLVGYKKTMTLAASLNSN